MAAYMLIAAKIEDRDKFRAQYASAAAALVAERGGKYIVLGPGAELLEGTLDGYTSVAVSEWPDRETALAFWNSPEYAEIKKGREGLAEVQVLLAGE
ncbi:MAG: DUF1330 domain-containing protein [Pseudomonadota bacterium]